MATTNATSTTITQSEPSSAFITVTTTAASPVIVAPSPFSAARHRQPPARWTNQCRTSPA